MSKKVFTAGQIRKDFPQLKRTIGGRPIVYLDSTATSLKPQSVIDKITEYYTQYCANIFRGLYTLSEESTAEYEAVREKTAQFIGAENKNEIVFTRNTSESINLVMYSWGRDEIRSGDQMVASVMEHHSNFVPWQQLAKERDATFVPWEIDSNGELRIEILKQIVTRKTKVLAITATSNVLGTIVPVAEIVKTVKSINPDCIVVVDAAQAVPHAPVHVTDWGADFVAFSSHKMLGPTGVGVLWGKMQHLERMRPFLYGGEMIREVYTDHTEFADVPHKFEAGTPHIAGVIGLGAAIDYLNNLGMAAVRKHEIQITDYALKLLQDVGGVCVYGPKHATDKAGVIAFTLKGVHAHDVAQILNEDNVFVRSGNHCAMPLHDELEIIATARASFYVYTTRQDIDVLVEGIEKAKRMFSK